MVFQYKICRYLRSHEITAYVEQEVRYSVLFHGSNTISLLLCVPSDCTTCSLGSPDCKMHVYWIQEEGPNLDLRCQT